MARWNNTSPPEYLYDPVTAPVALFWGQNDWLVVPEDEKDLAGRLPNLVTPRWHHHHHCHHHLHQHQHHNHQHHYQVTNTRVEEDAYTHLDFLWAMHNRKLLYQPTIEIMKEYLDNGSK